MKIKLIIIAVVLFMMISGIRTEGQEAISEDLIDTVKETKAIRSDTDLNQHFDNLTTSETNPTNPNQILHNLEEKEERDVINEEEEEKIIEEQKKLESEEEEEEQDKIDEKLGNEQRKAENKDYIDEYPDDSHEALLRLRREQLQMEHLSHQANLFKQLNLNHNFEDWSVNLDEEMEDMIRVLGHDENLPLKDPYPIRSQQDSSKNSSEEEKKSKWLFNEYNYFEPPFDAFYDSSETGF